MDWLDILGWNDTQINDLRFVGFSYIKQGKYEIARTLFEGLAVVTDNNPYDVRTLGALHLQLGQNLVALNYLERALTLDPNHASTKLNRIKALFALGYRTQASEQLSEILSHQDPLIASQAQALHASQLAK